MHTKSILLFFTLLISTSLIALPTDKDLPLQVVADAVSVNYAEGITTMQGNVTVTQGSTKLQGNKVIVYTDKHQHLLKLIAIGDQDNAASYHTLPTKNSSPFDATAHTITYLSEDKLAIFEGDAHATDGTNQFQGDNFSYWTEKQEVVTKKSNQQQSTIVIYPKQSH